MNTLNQLLRAIITNPDADDPRLQYADALDELPTVTVACRKCGGEGYVLRQPHNPGQTFEMSCAVCLGTGSVTDHTNHNRAEKIRDAVKLAANGQSYPETLGPTPEGMRPDINEGLPARLMATYYRGFFDTLECTADSFLRHADELIWHPTQTVKCSTCNGTNYVRRPCPLHKSGHESDCFDCVDGRVPRPCPDTSHPIRRVVLTTNPNIVCVSGNHIDGWVYGWANKEYAGTTRSTAEEVRETTDAGGVVRNQPAVKRVLNVQWPGVEFVLPTVGYPDPDATYIPIFDHEASTASHP